MTGWCGPGIRRWSQSLHSSILFPSAKLLPKECDRYCHMCCLVSARSTVFVPRAARLPSKWAAASRPLPPRSRRAAPGLSRHDAAEVKVPESFTNACRRHPIRRTNRIIRGWAYCRPWGWRCRRPTASPSSSWWWRDSIAVLVVHKVTTFSFSGGKQVTARYLSGSEPTNIESKYKVEY